MKQKWTNMYMDICIRISQESKSKRLKVASLLVKDNNIISWGINGLPEGSPEDSLEDDEGKTKLDTVHSEIHAIIYAARLGHSTVGSTLFVTHNPCLNCVSSIVSAGITHVVYRENYRDKTGIDKLKQYGVKVTKLNYEL